MKSFRATYTPLKYDKSGGCDGYDRDKVEQVVIVHIIGYDWERNPDIAFVHADGKLDVASLHCFSECIVDW